jgi:hypothetical protein
VALTYIKTLNAILRHLLPLYSQQLLVFTGCDARTKCVRTQKHAKIKKSAFVGISMYFLTLGWKNDKCGECVVHSRHDRPTYGSAKGALVKTGISWHFDTKMGKKFPPTLPES